MSIRTLTFATTVLALALSLGACKAGAGDTCKEEDDCGGGLTCCKEAFSVTGRGECRRVMVDSTGRDVSCDTPVTPRDSGPRTDTGAADTGPADTGAADTGPVDSGPVDSGPVDSGAVDSGPVDSGPVDSGPVDSGPVDSGPVDSGPVDAATDA